MRRVLGGQKPRLNSAHADLWLEIFHCAQDLHSLGIVVTKVAAHVCPADVASPLEEWCAFHNFCADRAAQLAQWKRPPDFWSFYARHVNAVQANRDLSSAVQQVLLRISQAVVRDRDVQGSEVRDELCDTPAVPPGAWKRLPPLHIPQQAVRWYGDDIVRIIMSWYWQSVDACSFPVVWVSHFQLYIDYVMSGFIGPVKLKSWMSGADAPEIDLLHISFHQRTRWFVKILKECLRHHGAGCHSHYCRPMSRAFLLHTGCIAVPWNPSRLDAIDDWVFSFCPHEVRRTSTAVSSLPCARRDDRFPLVGISTI